MENEIYRNYKLEMNFRNRGDSLRFAVDFDAEGMPGGGDEEILMDAPSPMSSIAACGFGSSSAAAAPRTFSFLFCLVFWFFFTVTGTLGPCSCVGWEK